MRVRDLRRTPERRQVHADERPGRREGRHHQRQAADDAAGHPRHPEPPRRAADHRGHPRHPQAAHAARRAAEQPRRAGAGRRRRDRVLRAREREGRPGRPAHRRVARRLSPREEGRDRHQDGCRLAGGGHRSPARGRRAARGLGRRHPALGAHARAAGRAHRRAALADAAEPAALSGRRLHRRVHRGPHRRDHPRGRARGRARRAAALHRRDDRGHLARGRRGR